MRVLIVHNMYRGPGGEDVVAKAEANLLRCYGHEVREYWRSNNEVKGIRLALKAPVQALWSFETVSDLESVIESFRPDVIHVHNTWLVVSPAVYWVAQRYGVPVVQTLHNYRLLCVNGLLLRNGSPCERCKGLTFAYPGVYFHCYRRSYSQSLLVATTIAIHRLLGTWQNKVSLYIALTNFACRKFVEGGLPSQKIVVKPNFVYPDPGPKSTIGSYALFVGRLSPEKGIKMMLEAWRLLPHVPLKVVGNGPMLDWVHGQVSYMPNIEVLGWCTREKLVDLLKGARFLVMPSVWYEAFPMSVVEAFACGVPVIASRLGALEEIVEDGRTGWLFAPGNPEDLADKVEWAWSHPGVMKEMGYEGRQEYKANYTGERNYQILMEIYQKALGLKE